MNVGEPTNLSDRARLDLVSILERSASVFGRRQARDLQRRIFLKCWDIADGLDHGHGRSDIGTASPTRFVVIRPFVIAYDPATPGGGPHHRRAPRLLKALPMITPDPDRDILGLIDVQPTFMPGGELSVSESRPSRRQFGL